MRRLVPFVLLAGVLLAAVAGGVAGARLADAATRPAHHDVVIRAPALAAGPAADALRAPGGFTGFGGAPALHGTAFRAGTVSAVDPSARTVTIASAEGDAIVHYTSTVRFFRLGVASAPLAVGNIVVVRYAGDHPVGVMRVPSGLEEGVGASQP